MSSQFLQGVLSLSLMAALGNLRYVAVQYNPIDWPLNSLSLALVAL